MEAGLELTRADRRLIQLGLAAEGFDPGPADGLFGPGTRGAIGRWQAARGEVSSGYLDQVAAKFLLASGIDREAEERSREEAETRTEQQRRDEDSQAAYRREPICPKWSPSGKENESCWREVDNRPGCFIWGAFESVKVEWSGGCNEGVAAGAGILETGLHFQEGTYVDERKHGYWVERHLSRIKEGPYVNGVKQGHWVERDTGGSLVGIGDELSAYMLGDIDQAEGSYANGKRNGDWVFRGDEGWMELISNGIFGAGPSDVIEAKGALLDGQRHGQWTFRGNYGDMSQGTYVKGKRHGQWVMRGYNPQGLGGPTRSIEEGTYSSDKKEGRWVRTYFDDLNKEGWSENEMCVAGVCN